MIAAQFETSAYSFLAFGDNEAEALHALRRAWEKHCQETDADPHFLMRNEYDVSYFPVMSGAVYRDGYELMQGGENGEQV